MDRPRPRLPAAMVLAWGGLLALAAAVVSAHDDSPAPPDTERAAGGPMPPEEVCATARLPPGFRLEPFAAEPAVRNPIAIGTDARGRLWVAENLTWAGNNLGVWDDTLRDRIVVLTDHDGDGRHDDRTVFWDEGTRVTSVAVGLGGVWVLDLPHLLFIPDRDDDLVPDGPPEIILDGFDETSVGHTPANGLTWGPDGWLWGRHGIQGTSRIGVPGAGDSQRVRINTGIWRYHPARRVVEKVMDGMTNSWGTDFDAHGETFVINTVIGHLWHAVHGTHVERMYGTDLEPDVYDLVPQVADHVHWDTGENWSDVRDGISDGTSRAGGGHAHVGLMIYQGDNWPAEYRGGVFTLNFHGRRINHDRLAEHGTTFKAAHGPDMCFIADTWFRGMDLVPGPDGGVFIADWSDTGECHDHDGVHRSSGRIYKLVYAPAGARPHRPGPPPGVNVAADDAAALRRHLVAENQWWSRAAVREWQRRSLRGDPLDDDVAWLRGQAERAADPLHRLRALWALAAIGDGGTVVGAPDGASRSDGGLPRVSGLDEEFLLARLDDPDPFVRSWGVRLLVDGCSRSGIQPSARVLERFVRAAADDGAAPVQRHLASAVSRLADAAAAAGGVPAAWRLAAALAGPADFAADPLFVNLIWYGLTPSVPRNAEQALALAATSGLPRLRHAIARRLAGEIETRPQIAARLLELAAAADPDRRRDLVTGIAAGLRGWRQAPAPPGYDGLSSRLALTTDEPTRQAVRELDVLFGAGRGLAEVREVAVDTTATTEARRQAIRTLAAAVPADGHRLLQGLLADRSVIAEALRGLARYDDPATPGLALARLPLFAPEDRLALVDLLTSRAAYAGPLLDAVEAGHVRSEEISAFHARQIAMFGDEQLTVRLARVWGDVRVTAADRQALIARWRRELVPEVLAAADPGAGRVLFQRDCAGCHVLFGAGRKLGPDLTGSNRRNLDYLLENIIDPGASVGVDFRAVSFILADGRAVTGVISAATDHTLTVQAATETLVLDRRDIAEQVVQPQSLMPDGLLAKLSDTDVRNLVAYLMSPDQVPLP